MRKLFRTSFAALAAALFSMTMISCGPTKPEPTPTTVTVTEQAKIVITGNTATVPVSGGTAEFPIKYNTSYTV